MKSMFKMTGVLLLMMSGAAFSAVQASPSAAKAPAVAHSTTVAPATHKMATHVPVKVAKQQIEAREKAALAACKKLHGAEKSTCKMHAEAKEKSAMAHLSANK